MALRGIVPFTLSASQIVVTAVSGAGAASGGGEGAGKLCSRFRALRIVLLAHSAKQHWYDWPNRKVNAGFRWFRERAFRPLMTWVVQARYVVLAGAVAMMRWFARSAGVSGRPWRSK